MFADTDLLIVLWVVYSLCLLCVGYLLAGFSAWITGLGELLIC